MKLVPSFILLFICLACNTEPDVVVQNPDALILYPNPARERVNISVNNPDGEAFTVSVFDTDGRIFFEETASDADTTFRIPLLDEPKGTWHAVLKTRNATVTRQFFKQ